MKMTEPRKLDTVDASTMLRRTIEQVEVATQTRVGPAVRQSMMLKTWEDQAVGDLVIALQAYLQTERLADDTVRDSIEVMHYEPRSTWQMFKRSHQFSWWLGWLVRRRPAQHMAFTQLVTLTAHWDGRATYPDSSYIPLPPEKFGSPVFHLDVATQIRKWGDDGSGRSPAQHPQDQG